MKRKKGEADDSFNVFGDGEVEEFGDEKELDGEDTDLYDDDEDEDDDEFGEEDSDFDEDLDGEDDLDIEEESLDGLVDDDE
jgi:ribonuclease E